MTATILIDGGCWTNQRGFGRFTRCLVAEMAKQAEAGELRILLDRADAESMPVPDGIEAIAVETSASPSSAAVDGGARRALDVLRFMAAARRCRPSVVFFPATYTYFPTPGLRSVVTVHDAMAESMPDLVVPRRLDRFRWTAKQRLALRGAAHVFTVSHTAAAEVRARLGIVPDRLSVIGEAPDPIFTVLDERERDHRLKALGRTERYLLYVGGFGPHKNVAGLVEAFDRVAMSDSEVELVLVGSLDDSFANDGDALRLRIKRSNHALRITTTGYVSDDDLVALYNGAEATVLPSLEEGFGLTAVESAACGTVVVANMLPSVRESLGDAAIYVDACHPAQFAHALQAILDDEPRRRALARTGLGRAAELSWSHAASTVLGRLRTTADR